MLEQVLENNRVSNYLRLLVPYETKLSRLFSSGSVYVLVPILRMQFLYLCNLYVQKKLIDIVLDLKL